MNKDKIIELLKDGAWLDTKEDKFFHPSFRKGWRKMTSSNISFKAAFRELYHNQQIQMLDENEKGIYKIRGIRG
jgi:hypothetical protein